VSKNNLNFIFFGTPDVGSETLEILKQSGYLPELIITSPDARRGRGLHMEASLVANFAGENNILCLKPEKLDEEFTLKLSTFNFQLFAVVAYGKIIPENILNMPKLGSINIHYSLLPKYRGASPVESAILNGDTETGVTIQKMEFKMDSGPIIAQEKVSIPPDEKAPELRQRLIKIGGELLMKILKTPSAFGHSPFAGGERQDESQATFCKKIKKEDGLVNLLEEQPSVLYNKFRAYASWPRIFFFSNGKRIIITDAVLENNQFVIKKVLPEGKKEISWEEFKKTNISK
jgi:methionyl-tRNA formyltransferase